MFSISDRIEIEDKTLTEMNKKSTVQTSIRTQFIMRFHLQKPQ